MMKTPCLTLLTLCLFTVVPVFAWNTFVVAHVDEQDDTPAFKTALASGNISANTSILFEKGVTYNIFSPIEFPEFNNIEVRIEGNLTYPEDISTIQGEFCVRIKEGGAYCGVSDIVGSSVSCKDHHGHAYGYMHPSS